RGRGGLFLAQRRQGKQLLDSDLELARQPEGDLRIREVRSGFNRVNSLPRDADSLRKVRSADAPSLANGCQIGLNTAHFISSLVLLRFSSAFSRTGRRACRAVRRSGTCRFLQLEACRLPCRQPGSACRPTRDPLRPKKKRPDSRLALPRVHTLSAF